MRFKKITFIVIMLVLLALVISATALAKKPVTDPEMVIWELTDTKVVAPGQTVEMEEGQFIQGYTLEAKAKSKGGNIVPNGVFRLTMDAFSPYQDMPGQRAGYWYVNGTWTVTKNNANPDNANLKHNPDVVDGTLMAELPFNPTGGAGSWTGKSTIQMALAAGRWTKGEGTLTFLGDLQGDLFLDLVRWPGAE